LKITIKLDYACRILAELARAYPEGLPVRLDHLAKVEAVPANFLAQILGELRNGKLVVSKRGVQGGFLLARPPEEITLYDIVRVIEGDLLELSGSHGGKTGRRMKQIWQEVRETTSRKAREFTLDKIALQKEPEMYHI
jgi:Rrf2 family transcriptional regulator, cysteine metabolism repressor